MAVTPSASTGLIILRSSPSWSLAASAFCCEVGFWVTAKSVKKNFRSPKCLLALAALLTTDTSSASSASVCESRASSRVRSISAAARMTSSVVASKISRPRIEKCVMRPYPSVVLASRPRDRCLITGAALASQKVSLHLAFALNVNHAARLKNKVIEKAYKTRVRYLDLVRNAVRFHRTCRVHRIPPDVIGEFVHADDAGNGITSVNSDADLE